MNKDLQTYIEPELEARIVALVLGEASAFEAEELERLMSEKPELNTFRTGLEKIHGVVAEAHEEQDDSEWQLSEGRRGKILAKIEERKRYEMIEARRKRISRIAQRRLIYTCAACLVLTLVILGLTQPMGSLKEEAPSSVYSTSEGQQMDSKEIDLTGGSNFVTQAKDERTLSFEWKSDGKDLEKWNYSKDTPETWDRVISDELSKKGQVSEALADLNDALAISPVEPNSLAKLEKKAESRYEKSQSGVTEQPASPPSTPNPSFPAKREMVAPNLTSTAAIKVPEIPDPASDFGDGFGIVDNDGFSSGGAIAGGIAPVSEPGDRPNATSPGDVVDSLDLKAGEASWDFELTDKNGRDSSSGVDPFGFEVAETEKAKALTAVTATTLGKKKSAIDSRSTILDSKEKEARGGEARGRQAGLKRSDKSGDSLNESARITSMPATALAPSDRNSVLAKGANRPGRAGKPSEVESLKIDGIGIPSQGETRKRRNEFESTGEEKPGAGGGIAGKQLSNEDRILDREINLREKKVSESDELLVDARSNYSNGNYETAVKKYREALKTLPNGTETKERREFLKKSLEDGAAALTQNYRRQGNYEEAWELAIPSDSESRFSEKEAEALKEKELPLNFIAGLNSGFDDQPDDGKEGGGKVRGLSAVLPVNSDSDPFADSREVRGNFFQYEPSAADPFSDNGGDPDPFSSADDDRDGLGGRGSERDRSLEMDIQSARAVPRYGEPTPEDLQVKEQIAQLNEVNIPEINFEDTTVAEAIEFLERKTREGNPEKGVDIQVRTPKTILPDGEEDLGDTFDSSEIKIKDLQLRNVPARVALQYVADAARLRYKVDGGGVILLPITDGEDADIVQNRWDISPGVASELREATANGKSIVTILKEQGISFPPNASARFLDDENMLVMRNSPTNMELMDGIVTAAESHAKAKTRTREAEWLLGEANPKTVETNGAETKLPTEVLSVKKDAIKGFETSTKEETDSTFSLNVSDVSFKLAKAALSSGNWPDASKVRPEEFVNALNYDDTKPTQAEKIACEIEQGSHPFMQQRNLMRVSMSTASLGRNAATPLRLTILLDQSGSMERADRAESVQRAFALLAAQLNPNDEVTLVGFARTPRLLAERVKGDEVSKLVRFVAKPLSEGGTNLEEALSTGLQLAKQQFLKRAQNRIILLTDGAANLGDAKPKNLASQVESMRRADIAFDACGVGADGLNDDVLSSLTKQGDGRYYFLDRPEDADDGFARQIAGALRPAAKNVKVQVLFNPERVSTFKLYGFEKHKLKKEDFRNDSVDAAEMAAEESGVALYHFEPMPEGRGDIGTVSVRFFDTASKQMVERTWSIPYQEEAEFFSKADPRLRLASVAALFAEKLKGSPVGDRVELKKLRQETQLLKSSFANQTRFNELQNMLQQAGD